MSHTRRDFIKTAAAASCQSLAAAPAPRQAILMVLPEAVAEPVSRAALELKRALDEGGVPAEIRHDLSGLKNDAERIVIAPASWPRS